MIFIKQLVTCEFHKIKQQECKIKRQYIVNVVTCLLQNKIQRMYRDKNNLNNMTH